MIHALIYSAPIENQVIQVHKALFQDQPTYKIIKETKKGYVCPLALKQINYPTLEAALEDAHMISEMDHALRLVLLLLKAKEMNLTPIDTLKELKPLLRGFSGFKIKERSSGVFLEGFGIQERLLDLTVLLGAMGAPWLLEYLKQRAAGYMRAKP